MKNKKLLTLALVVSFSTNMAISDKGFADLDKNVLIEQDVGSKSNRALEVERNSLEQVDLSNMEEQNIHGPDLGDLLEPENDVVPFWGGITHSNIASKGFDILYNSKGGHLSWKFAGPGLGGRNARDTIIHYARATDDIENQMFYYTAHFYNPYLGRSYSGSGFNPHEYNAYKFFNNHYYYAKQEWASGNAPNAYKELGMAIHYLQDLNAPHHAALALAPGYQHVPYENAVNNSISKYYINFASNDTFDFMRYSTFKAIADNFSTLADSSFHAMNFDNSFFGTNMTLTQNQKNHTRINLERTQRAIAGILYRFLIDTNQI